MSAAGRSDFAGQHVHLAEVVYDGWSAGRHDTAAAVLALIDGEVDL